MFKFTMKNLSKPHNNQKIKNSSWFTRIVNTQFSIDKCNIDCFFNYNLLINILNFLTVEINYLNYLVVINYQSIQSAINNCEIGRTVQYLTNQISIFDQFMYCLRFLQHNHCWINNFFYTLV